MAYVALEGGEGTGKSTQARVLAERLDAVLVHEPGYTDLGVRLRKLLLDPGQAPVSARAETLLMAADRAQLMFEVVEPALAAGRHVVSDRSAYSSLAYQGGGRKLGVDDVRRVNEWALEDRWPDVVVLLDVDQETARGRLDRSLDRLELEADAFHERVRSTYLELADLHGWIVVPATGSVEDVAVAVWDVVAPHIDRGVTAEA